ncbi:MAG: CAP domain-containing protein [Oceanipulchritudo sp.]
MILDRNALQRSILSTVVLSLFFPQAGTATPYDHGDPTPYEQLMLELLNRARANPGAEATRLGIDLNEGLNPGTIEDSPKPPLAFHPYLIQSARAHSGWMLDFNIFSHTGAGGSDAGDRMEDAGYFFLYPWAWGENIAWGGTTGVPDVEAYTVSRHEGLFISPGHRKNICNANFDEVGLGVLTGQFSTSQNTYNAVMATQNFARSDWTPGPLLLGVVFTDLDGDNFYDPGEGAAGVTVSAESGDYDAVTSSSGGYAFPFPAGSGSISVVFSGGPLPSARYRTINRTGENIKLDLDLAEVRTVGFVPGSLRWSQNPGFSAQVTGTPGTSFQLQHSTDMQTWTTVQQPTLQDPLMSVSHLPEDPGGPHFYRLVWVE